MQEVYSVLALQLELDEDDEIGEDVSETDHENAPIQREKTQHVKSLASFQQQP